MRMTKIMGAAVITGALAFSIVGSAAAHVVVKPGDVQTGAYQTFTVGVPTERNTPTVRIRLVIPEDIASVRPSVKAGWVVQAETNGTGDEAAVTAITWSGGEIGAGLRDDFTFSAKTPDHEMDVAWKVYQTYGDGTVVAWDQAEGSDSDSEDATSGAYSVTRIAADTAQDKALRDIGGKADNAGRRAGWALGVGVGGIVLACAALSMRMNGSARKPSRKK